MTDAGLGLAWSIRFNCESSWLTKHVGEAIEALQKAAVWSELDSFGPPRKAGKPFKANTDLVKLLRRPTVLVLTRGSELEAMPLARLTLETQRDCFIVTLSVHGSTLESLGTKAVEEVAAVVRKLAIKWRSGAQLAVASASPFATTHEPFHYARSRPPRYTWPVRMTDAIVDVLDPQAHGDDDADVVAGRALAISKVPKGGKRVVHDGIVTVTFLTDLHDREVVAAACALHESWLFGVLPTQTAAGWNEAGDFQVLGGYHRVLPPFTTVFKNPAPGDGRQRLTGLVSAKRFDKKVEQVARVRTVEGHVMTEVALVLPTRAAALEATKAAKAAGFDRVLHEDGDTGFWDPDPPGRWTSKEAHKS